MATLNFETFDNPSDLKVFADAEAAVTLASTEAIIHRDGKWYLFYWTA